MVDPTRSRYRQLPLVSHARLLRRNPTPSEKKLWLEFLRDRPEGFTRHKAFGGYVPDFYCAGRRLAIELVDRDAEREDADRTHVLASLGLRVLTFTNREVTAQFEGVCERIKAALGAFRT
jgi:very-short-patch-repair endonuclease